MQLLFLLKRFLGKLIRSFCQLLYLVFVGLPVGVLTLIFPSLRRRFFSKKVGDQNLSKTSGVRKELADKARAQFDFLLEVLQATREGKGNSEVVYSLLAANLDKLDGDFIAVLQNWGAQTFSKVEASLGEELARVICNFACLISNFSCLLYTSDAADED